jgi:hypothetical protein
VLIESKKPYNLGTDRTIVMDISIEIKGGWPGYEPNNTQYGLEIQALLPALSQRISMPMGDISRS